MHQTIINDVLELEIAEDEATPDTVPAFRI